MANINRDYLIVLDAKSSVISEADELKYYITDEHSQNLFVNLVVRDIERINKYVEVHDPEKYQLELHIVKPNNDIVRPHLQANLLSVPDAIYAFELPKEAVDYIGTYKCELRVTYKETEETTVTTSNKFKYKVKRSIYNNLDAIQDAPQYPIVIQLFDKLSDINQYEEDRRANELARQLAEEQRQARFDVLDADVTDSIQAMDDKVVEVENRISAKEHAVDTLIADAKADIDNYKVAKDQEIDEYKTAKDTEINNAITAQDNKIDTAINAQNDRITVVENNDATQDNRLDNLENRATLHESRLTDVEAKNAEQDNRLDVAENRLANIGNDITNTMQPIIDAHTSRLDAIEAIDVSQNDRIAVVESNVVAQNSKLDTLETKAATHEARITAVEAKDAEQDSRLGIAENRLNNIGNDITNTMQPIIDAHTSRLDAIEAIDVSQNNRLDIIEAKNQQQDDRLLDIEKVNNKQGIDIKCLYGASQTIDVTKEGNSIHLQNSNNGFAIIDEIKGNTLVNCNKEPDKELILNGNINTSGDNTVTITKGVDGGKVDVVLEGNTLVNVSKTKDVTALPLDEELTYLYPSTPYTVQFVSDRATTADITLGGTSLLAQSIVAGLNRISITTPETLANNKLVIDGTGAKISEVVVTDTDREFGYFEGMKSVGQDDVNGHKIEILSQNKNLLPLSHVSTDSEGYGNRQSSNWDNVRLKPNTKYTLSYTGKATNYTNNYMWGIWIREQKTGKEITDNHIIKSEVTDISLSFTTTNEEYYKIQLVPNNGDTTGSYLFKPNTVILEEGEKTSYVPYALNKKEILLTEPLRAVGDAKDRYVLIDGKWYIERNTYAYKITKDTEAFALDNTFENYEIFGINTTNFPSHPTSKKPLCNNFLTQSANWNNLNHEEIECVQTYNNDRIFIKILSSRLPKVSDYVTNNFKEWLTNNEISIIYSVTTPIYEPIDYNPLEVYSDITHISTNSTIPANITVKNHGYNCLLKPSTTYTISSNLGLNTVTTPSTLNEDCLRFMDTDTSDVTTMKDVLVLEGDWTTKADLIPANFSGIESAFEQEYDAEKGKYKVNAKVANEDKSKENNITFYINEPLRGIDDVKDRVYVKDDKVVVQRNYISVTFDGSDDEDWKTVNNRYARLLLAKKPKLDNNNRCKNYMCDTFKKSNNLLLESGIFINDAIRVKTEFISNAEEARVWFAKNPTTVVYQLAEPTYEEVEYNDVKLFIESFKNSTLSYNSNVPVTSKLYYSYSVPLVDTVAQTASISDEQDVMIIDLATQVAVMEMLLM